MQFSSWHAVIDRSTRNVGASVPLVQSVWGGALARLNPGRITVGRRSRGHHPPSVQKHALTIAMIDSFAGEGARATRINRNLPQQPPSAIRLSSMVETERKTWLRRRVEDGLRRGFQHSY
jgi:hypothetical protein